MYGCDHMIADLITTALREEEEGLQALRSYPSCRRDPRQELLSVAFADELAVEYLIRRRALAMRVPLTTQLRYTSDRRCADIGFIDPETDTVYAVCELKKRGVWDLGILIPDIKKLFAPTTGIILGANPDVIKYCAWVLIDNAERSGDDLKLLVKRHLEGVLDDIVVTQGLPIPINTFNGAPYVDHGHHYRTLHVVLISGSFRGQ